MLTWWAVCLRQDRGEGMGKLTIADFANFYTTRRQNHDKPSRQCLTTRITILGARIAKFSSDFGAVNHTL
jgi:hypothetical protein